MKRRDLINMYNDPERFILGAGIRHTSFDGGLPLKITAPRLSRNNNALTEVHAVSYQ